MVLNGLYYSFAEVRRSMCGIEMFSVFRDETNLGLSVYVTLRMSFSVTRLRSRV